MARDEPNTDRSTLAKFVEALRRSQTTSAADHRSSMDAATEELQNSQLWEYLLKCAKRLKDIGLAGQFILFPHKKNGSTGAEVVLAKTDADQNIRGFCYTEMREIRTKNLRPLRAGKRKGDQNPQDETTRQRCDRSSGAKAAAPPNHLKRRVQAAALDLSPLLHQMVDEMLADYYSSYGLGILTAGQVLQCWDEAMHYGIRRRKTGAIPWKTNFHCRLNEKEGRKDYWSKYASLTMGNAINKAIESCWVGLDSELLFVSEWNSELFGELLNTLRENTAPIADPEERVL